MAFAQDGDTIRVKSINRLARGTRELLKIVVELTDKEVSVDFLDFPMLNVSSKEGGSMLTVFATFAELERESICERQPEVIALAKAAGKCAKAPKLNAEQVQEAHPRVADSVPKTQVARDLGVSRQKLYDAMGGRGR